MIVNNLLIKSYLLLRCRARGNLARPEDFRKSFYTTPRNDLIQFDYGDSDRWRTSPYRWKQRKERRYGDH